MKLVLDSSVALKWFLSEPDSDRALALRDGYLKQVHELLVPDVFPIEVAHAMAKAERRKVIAPPVGAENLADLLAILPPVHPSLPLLPRGLRDCLGSEDRTLRLHLRNAGGARAVRVGHGRSKADLKSAEGLSVH